MSDADLLRRAAEFARAVGDTGVPGALAAMLECASRMDDPQERESVASDQCGWCGYSHLTAIAQVILGEGA